MSRLLLACLLVTLLVTLVAGTAAAVLPTKDEPVRNVWLIRHGEYVHGVEDDPDEGELVALGRQQARLVAARLAGYPITFTSLQASSMNRARQTAEILVEFFPQMTPALQVDIRECTPPTTRADIMAGLGPGEPEGCQSTLEDAWLRIFRPAEGTADENDIVVCHGNVIRWFMARAVGNASVNWLQASIANCSLTVIQVRADGSVKLISFADSGHIPWGMTTYPGVEVEQ